mmetsp:Transcript_735/g.1668  ORF Transcript_735/g.1668 Transcript_735/m.1668 type:complete len:149 (-) Transcript_735:1378-1824(-)
MSDTRNAVSEDANWTHRILTETRVAKHFSHEWGFLTETQTRSLSRSASPVKYVGRGSTIVKQLRVPEKEGNESKLPKIDAKRLEQRPLRPSTAMESVVMSNHLMREYLDRTDPFFIPTSTKYGSRLTLEQFGVGQFGIHTTRSKLPSN